MHGGKDLCANGGWPNSSYGDKFPHEEHTFTDLT